MLSWKQLCSCRHHKIQNNGHMLQMYHMQGLIAKWFKIIALKHEMLAFPTPLSQFIFLAFLFSYMSCGRD